MSKEKKPLVSVIIPVYNAENFIRQTLDSVISQTYKNIEIICVNDCSTDKSLEILNEYVKNDNRIKVYSNEINSRVAKTRNHAVLHATGEYLAFCDADDIWRKEKIEKQIAFMQKENCDLCYTAINFIDNDGKDIGKQFYVPEEVNYKKLLKQNVITMSSAVVKKELFDKHPMHNDELHEDFILWLEILKHENAVAKGLNEILVDYRFTLGSKSRNKLKSMKMTYKTYKLMKLNFFTAHFNLACYIIRSLKKYGKEAVR